jgi:superfamily II DNA helicase RecQ
VALGVTTQRSIPGPQVRQGLARAIKTTGGDADLHGALQDELGVGSEALFGSRAEQVEEIARQMQGAGLANDLGRQLVETVGENLEQNPHLTTQQFRERRLARMRQWDRATGDPETTDRIVGGLIGLGAFTDANVREVPRPPTSPADPGTASSVAKPSVTPEAAIPTTRPTVASTKPAPPLETEHDPALFEQLRSWRLAAAQQEGQKAFYVFADATLERIAAARPQTLDELEAVKGVGPKKLEQYGQAVLDITREEGDAEA